MEAESGKIVGVLEFYGSDGTVGDRVTYTDPQRFRQDLEDSLYCGRTLTATAFTRPGQGPAVSAQWFMERVSNPSSRYQTRHCPGRRAKKKALKKQNRGER